MGNVCLEAGLTCATVIASNVDKARNNKHSATVLIDPTLKISDSFSFDQGGFRSTLLIPKMENEAACTDPIIIKVALENIKNPALQKRLAVNLQKKVITEFR